jgi:hypothetical protein
LGVLAKLAFQHARHFMPLDPIVKGFLDQMAAAGGPKMSEAGAAVARETFVGMMQIAGPKDVPVGKTENLTVPGPGGPFRSASTRRLRRDAIQCRRSSIITAADG